ALRERKGKGRLELERLVDRLLDEELDRLLTPRPQRTAPETTGKPLDPGKPHAPYLRHFAIEHGDAGVRQDAPDFVLLAALVVVVAQHGYDRNLHGRGQFAREYPRLIRKAVVG